MLNFDFSQKEVNALKNQAVVGGFIPSAGALIQEKKENDLKQAEAQRQKILEREAQLAAADAAAAQRKAEEEAQRNESEASRWAGLVSAAQAMEDFRREEREVYVTPPKGEKPSWWGNLLDTGKGLLGSALSLIGNPTGSWGGSNLAAPFKQGGDPPPPDDNDPPQDDTFWWEKLKNDIQDHWQKTFNKSGTDLTNPLIRPEIDDTPLAAAMNTYIASGINVQYTSTNAPDDKDAGNGPAQVSYNQLNADYGKGYDCNEKGEKCRGYGLGLPGTSPFNDDIAIRAMNNRIQQVIDEAERLGEKNDITIDNTDRFIIAALSQNGAGFDLDDIKQVMKSQTEDGLINWDSYFEERQEGWERKMRDSPNWQDQINNIRSGGDDYNTKFILREFIDEIEVLKEEGYYLPADVDMQRIKELSEGISPSGENAK